MSLVMPKIGQVLIPNAAYIENNVSIIQEFPFIQSGKEYEILKVTVLEEFPDEWGITAIKDLVTGQVADLSEAKSLSDYWTLFVKDDSIRIVDPVE